MARGDHGSPRRPGHREPGGTIDTVPELPEVESLAVFLRERATGAEIDWAASTAISVLKTYRPDLSALSGSKGHRDRPVRQVPRRDQRAGAAAPGDAPRPGRLAALEGRPAGAAPQARQEPARLPAPVHRRQRFRPDRGRHQEAARGLPGHRPAAGAGRGLARPGPAGRRLHRGHAGRPAQGPPHPDQGRAAGPEDHRGHRQRLLRRGAARGQDVAVQDRFQPDPGRGGRALRGDDRVLARGGRAQRGPGRRRPQGGEEVRPAGARPRPASRARSAATRCGRCRSPTPRCSTARPARPAASRSPTAACPGC